MKLHHPENFRSSKPSILFIHGFASSHVVFDKNKEGLRKNFNCFAIDLFAGIGAHNVTPDVNVDSFADEIISQLTKLKLPSLTLCGHSYGAQVAINIAYKAAGLLEQLVLIAPSGFETFNQFEQLIAQPFLPWSSNRLHNGEIEFLRPAFYNFEQEEQKLAAFILDNFRHETGKHFMTVSTKVMMDILSAPTFNMLPHIHKPALVIFGDSDRLIPNLMLHPFLTTSSVAASGARALPFGSYRMIARSGHFVMWEHAEAVNELIYKFAYTSTVIQPSLL